MFTRIILLVIYQTVFALTQPVLNGSVDSLKVLPYSSGINGLDASERRVNSLADLPDASAGGMRHLKWRKFDRLELEELKRFRDNSSSMTVNPDLSLFYNWPRKYEQYSDKIHQIPANTPETAQPPPPKNSWMGNNNVRDWMDSLKQQKKEEVTSQFDNDESVKEFKDMIKKLESVEYASDKENLVEGQGGKNQEQSAEKPGAMLPVHNSRFDRPATIHPPVTEKDIFLYEDHSETSMVDRPGAMLPVHNSRFDRPATIHPPVTEKDIFLYEDHSETSMVDRPGAMLPVHNSRFDRPATIHPPVTEKDIFSYELSSETSTVESYTIGEDEDTDARVETVSYKSTTVATDDPKLEDEGGVLEPESTQTSDLPEITTTSTLERPETTTPIPLVTENPISLNEINPETSTAESSSIAHRELDVDPSMTTDESVETVSYQPTTTEKNILSNEIYPKTSTAGSPTIISVDVATDPTAESDSSKSTTIITEDPTTVSSVTTPGIINPTPITVTEKSIFSNEINPETSTVETSSIASTALTDEPNETNSYKSITTKKTIFSNEIDPKTSTEKTFTIGEDSATDPTVKVVSYKSTTVASHDSKLEEKSTIQESRDPEPPREEETDQGNGSHQISVYRILLILSAIVSWSLALSSDVFY